MCEIKVQALESADSAQKFQSGILAEMHEEACSVREGVTRSFWRPYIQHHRAQPAAKRGLQLLQPRTHRIRKDFSELSCLWKSSEFEFC